MRTFRCERCKKILNANDTSEIGEVCIYCFQQEQHEKLALEQQQTEYLIHRQIVDEINRLQLVHRYRSEVNVAFIDLGKTIVDLDNIASIEKQSIVFQGFLSDVVEKPDTDNNDTTYTINIELRVGGSRKIECKNAEEMNSLYGSFTDLLSNEGKVYRLLDDKTIIEI